MENWLRCNKCYQPAMNSSKEFFVTQCEHVFCGACVVEARKKCPECKAVDSQTIILRTPMPQQMLHYFTSASSLVDRTLDATRFQQNQFMILLRHARHVDEKYEKGKKFYDQASKEMKTLSATRAKLRENIEKLRAADARSAAVPASVARSSIVHREDQNERTIACVSMNTQSQCRDPRIFPNTLNPHCSQRTTHELACASRSVRPRESETSTARANPISSRPSTNNREQQIKSVFANSHQSVRPRSNVRAEPRHRMITESSKTPVSVICNQSDHSTDHQQQQIKRALKYNQTSVRPRSNAHAAPQHRMITESSNIPAPVTSGQSRNSTNHQQQQIKLALAYNQSSVLPRSNAHAASQHRMIKESSNITSLPISSQSHPRNRCVESQNMRPAENAQMNGYQNHPNSQMVDYRYNQNSGYNSCQYPPRAIISSDCSSWIQTPQEPIHRGGIDRRIPKSIDTSGMSHSGDSRGTFCNTPNPATHFSNYKYRNML